MKMHFVAVILLALGAPFLWRAAEILKPADPEPVYLSVQVELVEPDPDFDIHPGFVAAIGSEAKRIGLHVDHQHPVDWQFQYWLPAGSDRFDVLDRLAAIDGVAGVDFY